MPRYLVSHRPSSRALLILLAVALSGPAELLGQLCGNNEPAFPVPECRNELNGDEVACTHPNAVRLWPSGFRPGLPGQRLPENRDSTSYTSSTIPGAQFGHELFLSLDIVGNYLYVAYNAGIQVWNIAGANAENPTRVFFRDGWLGHFLAYPPPGEADGFTDDIDAIDPAGGNQDVLIAVSGRDGSGMNLWQHTLSPSGLEQLYQDLGDQSVRIEIAELGGIVYAFAANFDGVHVYDVSRALALASPCLDDRGTVCPGVYRGELGDMSGGNFVTVIGRNGKLYVGASDGRGNVSQPFTFEIWETSNPGSPGTAIRKFQGLSSNVRGPEFFIHGGTYYLAVVDLVGSSYVFKIFNVNHCLDADGCASLGTPVFQQTALPTSASNQRVTYSESNGTPFLFYGFDGGVSGSKKEKLLDLTALGTGPNPPLGEITDGGGMYLDACNGLMVDYWGDYYNSNDKGLRNVSPRMGMFKGDYFYRAAVGILDVHKRTGPGVPKITTTVDDPPPHYMSFPIDFSATAENCTGTGAWSWFDDDTVASTIVNNGSTATFTFGLCAGSDCPERSVEVWALKDDCAGDPLLIEQRETVTVLEPRPQIRAIDVCPQSNLGCAQVPVPEFPVCTPLRFTAEVDGRPSISYLWEAKDELGTVLAMGSQPVFDWMPDGAILSNDLFADGFESGDTSAWSFTTGQPGSRSPGATPQKADLRQLLPQLFTKGGGATAAIDIDLAVANTSGNDLDTQALVLTGLGPLGFGAPAITITDQGGGLFAFQANSQNATEWRWEFEDPGNGTATGCLFYTSCQIYDWGQDDDQTTFMWQPPNVPGMYGVTVSIRNCIDTGPLSESAVVDVTVISNPDPPEITGFTINDPDCTLALGFYECLINRSITFEVTSTGNPTTYEFDWDEDATGDWDQQIPVGSPITHTFTTVDTVRPRVRAIRGAEISDPFLLDGTIIVTN